ncbi:MAG: MarR family transcriptional regulator [Candidatus Pacebacteria bacterium]|nr:MarR family transcriptional regulator [Candidatus Paceibacterota bacterium]
MTTRKELIDQLIQELRPVKRFLSPVASHKGDITPSQWAVLGLLRQGPLTVKEVAATLGISSSAATQLVDALVKAGHIDRAESAEDRRAVTLTMSKKTAVHVAKMREEHVSRLSVMFEILSDTELKTYVALTKKIAEAVTNKTSTL